MGDFNFIEQLVNPFVTERLREIYQNDEIYKERLKEEDLIYEKLSKELLGKQTEQLEEYFTAVNATMARKETLTYVQGMRDLLALLKLLS